MSEDKSSPDEDEEIREKPLDAEEQAELTGVTIIDPPSDELPKQEITLVGPTDDERFVMGVEAVAALPTIPGKDEFLSLAMQARILSMSGAAPEAIRNNPQVAFHVAMVGRDLGISPTSAMELVDLIPVKKDGVTSWRISLSPELMAGQVRRMGLGRVVVVWRSRTGAVARAFGPHGKVDHRCKREHVEDCRCEDVLGDSEFTVQDAILAGLVDRRCNIDTGEHFHGTTGRWRDDKCGCNQGYITYPARMFGWRSEGFGVDDWFPEASLGLYSPEALGALVDDEGRPIDPASVALPPGYEPPEPPPPVNAEPVIADEDTRVALKARIDALDDVRKSALLEAWREREIVPLGRLPESKVSLVSALIALQEREAGTTTPEPAPAEAGGDGAPAEGSSTPEPAETPTAGDESPPGEPEVAPEALEAAIAEVAVMPTPLVKSELSRRRQALTGNVAELRRRLTLMIALDRSDAMRGVPATLAEQEPLVGTCKECGRTDDIAQVNEDGTAWCSEHQPF